jgi:hypothetical protein
MKAARIAATMVVIGLAAVLPAAAEIADRK